MKTILVPTDFSANSKNAVLFAINLAKKTKASILLLHVFESSTIFTEIPLTTMQMDFAVAHDAAAKKLKAFYAKIKSAVGNINVELKLAQGLPSARVSEVALERKVDMIILATTSENQLERFLLGSNATRIISHAPCLVLAIPPKSKFTGFSKIVYSTDLTDDSISHTNTIIPFAKIFNSEILFLHVNSLYDRPEINDDVEELAEKISHIDYKKKSGFVSNDEDIPSGINNFIKHHKTDCIAMYKHHKNLLQKLFRKSITKSVSYHNRVPLLVIHEKDFMDNG